MICLGNGHLNYFIAMDFKPIAMLKAGNIFINFYFSVYYGIAKQGYT